MMNKNYPLGCLSFLTLAALWGSSAGAQSISVSEDFTGTSTTNNWFAIHGACLTAGSVAGTASSTVAGVPPGCTADTYYAETLVGGYNGVSGSGKTLPDPIGYGALRFTNGCIGTSSTGCPTGGLDQNGAIISGSSYSSSAGIQITFKTTTYRGNSYNGSPNGDSDGADGMSFFLIDGSVTPNIGSYGGSLGYTCSNGNSDYHGMVGGYIALGIDEFGNFLNQSDNTASGFGYVPNRIGLRGAGSIAWSALSTNYSSYYPSSTYGATTTTTNGLQNSAVEYTCKNGYLSNSSGAAINSTGGTLKSGQTATTVYDYLAIPSAYKVLSDVTIADEYSKGGYSRQVATTIIYKLKITPAGLLSLSYSIGGGAWQGVLANQSITASNGTLPATIRFGFAGSTGGGSNIHEVLCFKAASLDASSSSAASNLQNSSKLTSSSQAYFAYYNPNNWTGQLTANALTTDTAGDLFIATTATWDSACVLTGVATGSTCVTTGGGPQAAEAPTSRVILTYDGSTGIPFEWTNLTAAQQAALNVSDSNGTTRLNYLRGDRTQEITNTGSGLYRDRDLVLSDIVDSSPIAVGQPVSAYAITWQDKLDATDVMQENSGTQTYSAFYTAEQTRQNMVYVGANDGMLHGFRAGSYNTSNVFITGASSTNDGTELLAYVPASVLQSAASSTTSGNCVSTVVTQSVVQNIHGVTPAIGGSATCTQATLDFSNSQYGHNFFVDATPGSGDLFYQGAWHTWLVSGLGAGGSALFALDITNPSTFSETNASSLVLGEWTASNLTCANVSGCGNNLGNTYGTPIIRRMHNGDWAVIFGNGFSSPSGDAGVYVMTVNQTSGAKTFYYLSTGDAGSNGIAYVSSADLDGDHVADYLYAGDLQGNVWRFDVTGATPSSWAAGSAPLFSAGSSHPITASLAVAIVTGVPGTQIMVAFGTGQQFALTNLSATTYASGSQSLYAVWDWNLAAWNAKSSSQYAALNTATTNFSTTTGLYSPYTITPSLLTAQTLAVNTSLSTVDITSYTICWAGTTTCSGSNHSFGWATTLPSSGEQIVYNPEVVGTAFVVNSLIPAANSVLNCTTSNNTGYTYAITLATGAASTTISTVTTTVTTNATTGTTTTTVTTTINGVSTTTTSTTTGTATTNGTTTTSRNVAQNFFVANNDSNAAAALTNAVGTSFAVATTVGGAPANNGGVAINGSPATCTQNCAKAGIPGPFANIVGCAGGLYHLVSQTSGGTPTAVPANVTCPLTGQRVSWSQKR